MDKIKKIRQEIKRLRKEIKDDKDPLAPNQKAGYLFALADMESFLNTLSEEPSESPEEAAEEYFYRNWSDGSLDIKPQVKEDFIAGAEWQAEKDARDMYMSDNRHYEKVYQLGKKDMKKQMMQDAVDAIIYGYDDGSYELIASWLDLPKGIYKNGDKVKIIIVKEENK